MHGDACVALHVCVFDVRRVLGRDGRVADRPYDHLSAFSLPSLYTLLSLLNCHLNSVQWH